MKVKLEQVAEVRAGHPFRGAIKEIESGNGYVVQLRDLDEDGQVAWDSLKRTDVIGRREPDWLKQDDVVFSARGNRNLASIVPMLEEPTVCAPHFFLINVKPGSPLMPEFLAWQLNQADAQRYFQQSAEGSSQVSIRRQVLEQVPIVIPPLEKQKVIVELANAALREKSVYQKLAELRRQQVDAVARNLLRSSNELK